ncbi:MAG: ComEC/Rec2 family competence protein [Micromonosporaceae bacterium]
MSDARAANTASGPDLRAAAPALGAWLTALWALHLSPGQALGIVVTAGLMCGACWHLSRRRIIRLPQLPVTLTLGLLLGAVSAGAATAAHTFARDAEPLAGLTRMNASIDADVTVADDPRQVRGDGSVRSRVWLVKATLQRFRPVEHGEGQPHTRVRARVLILSQHSGWRGALPGQQMRVTGRLEPTRGGDLRAAVLSVTQAPQPRGAPPLLQRAAGSLRDGLQRATDPLPDETGGLLPGLAVGDVSQLEPTVEEDFKATGMTHLTAVSGSNVAIIVGAVLLLTAWGRAGPRTAAVLSLLALVGFVILARPSPSVLRAAVMGALALVALASGRPRAAVPGLAIAVWLLVVIDPELAADFGFALSVLATAGLLLLAPRWRDALLRRRVPRGIAEALAAPVAAQVACAPVIAAMTGSISVSSAPANLLAAPAVAPATIAGVSAAAISPVWPQGAEFLAWLGSWPAGWLVAVARWGAAVPGGVVSWPGGAWGGCVLAASLTALLVLCRSVMARRVLAVTVTAALLGALGARTVAPGWPPYGWVLVACDVGQGDALALHAGPGQAVVVDAGPDPAAVDRCLDRLDVTVIPLLVITHHHADHVSGLDGVVRGRRVAAFAAPEFEQPRHGPASKAGFEARGIAAVAPRPGWRQRIGPLSIEILGPDGVVTGSRSDSNNNSLILRVTARGITMLLAGDAEVDRQQAMLSHGEPVRADVLKVAHHGSAFQDPEFLEAVDPIVAVVSVGADNEYGHPKPSLIQRLLVGGARVCRTDLDGDIAVSRSADGLAVIARGPQPTTGH